MMKPLFIGDLKIDVPIIQGGMGVAVSLSGLASAVANQGGVGIISAAAIGMTEPGYRKKFHEANIRALRREIRQARSQTKGVIGVNIMMALTDHEALIKVAIEEEVDLIVIGAGLPLHIPRMIREAGLSGHRTKIIPKVSSAKAAHLIFRYWAEKYNTIPDAVVIEGPMAGGHLGFAKDKLDENRVPLTQLVKDTVAVMQNYRTAFNRNIPVIAGGGVHTGSDMYQVMQAGAQAVKIGTRFVTTQECDASDAYKQAYIDAKEEDIVIIDSPLGLPGRVVKTKFVEQIMRGETKPIYCPVKCMSSCNYKEAPYCIAQALYNSAIGDMDQGFAFAGTNAWRATQINTVADVMNDLIVGFHQEVYQQQRKKSAASSPQMAVPDTLFAI
ncbi:MAG: nitronate monooxygenase [Bacteroidales bacterium]|nr:nitronate monooxygenase [Bacteroidales bacterium]